MFLAVSEIVLRAEFLINMGNVHSGLDIYHGELRRRCLGGDLKVYMKYKDPQQLSTHGIISFLTLTVDMKGTPHRRAFYYKARQALSSRTGNLNMLLAGLEED